MMLHPSGEVGCRVQMAGVCLGKVASRSLDKYEILETPIKQSALGVALLLC